MNLDPVAAVITPNFILDVGACVGSFTRESKERWPSTEALMIEGNEECRAMLAAVGQLFVIALLSDTEKDAIFYTRKGSPTCTGASCYRELTPFYEGENAVPNTVRTTTLDAVCEHLILTGDVLLKIDVQGSELDVLRGGLKTLAKCKAVIVEVALADYNEGAPQEGEVNGFLTEHGFNRVAALGDIVHPIGHNVIQRDDLYLKR